MMKLTRYYRSKQLNFGQIRAMRDVLTGSFDWGLAEASYELYFVSEVYRITTIKEVEKVVQNVGQPQTVRVFFKSKGGRTIAIDTCHQGRISIEVHNLSDPPTKLLDAIETALSLELLGELPSEQNVSSAFLAHSFNDDGAKYSNELARFLTLLGIRCESGRAFSPSRVSDKVNSRLARHDMFVAIASPQDDYTWITQEIATASVLKKHIFVLKEATVELKPGILGDLEYIPFPKDQFTKAFIPILEGLNELRGESIG